MRPKPRLRKLPKPSVFLHQERWVCEYYEFDENSRPIAKRKAFFRDLKNQGKQATAAEQKAAATAFADQIQKQQKEAYSFARREKEQKHLTPAQLKEAKAAFAIFDQIPNRNKSLVDAVILYRESLKLVIDTPPLEMAIDAFLGRKEAALEKKAAVTGKKSSTLDKLGKHVRHMGRFFLKERPSVKLGEITATDLKRYFLSIPGSERNRINYVSDVGNFFNDASNPKDPHRLLNVNPIDAARLELRRDGLLPSKSKKKDEWQVQAPKLLTIDQVRNALEIAIELKEHGILGFVVLGLFVGLRPSETDDMFLLEDHWTKFVRLEEGIFRVDGFGKEEDRRIVSLSDNAVRWLRYLKEHNLPLAFKKDKRGRNGPFAKFRARAYLPTEEDAERLIRLRNDTRQQKEKSTEDKAFQSQANKLLDEYTDVLRHTFGTNYYYTHGFDINATVKQMGNSNRIFVRHYRGLPEDHKEHESYWKLVPSDFGL